MTILYIFSREKHIKYVIKLSFPDNLAISVWYDLAPSFSDGVLKLLYILMFVALSTGALMILEMG